MFPYPRLVVLSLRAQSLLNLKLYKMKRHELKDYQKTIQDVLARSEDDQPAQEQPGQISPTPSPAGSEGSNCSKVRREIVKNSQSSLLQFIPQSLVNSVHVIYRTFLEISPAPTGTSLYSASANLLKLFQSSDYYSSGENRMPGVLTPPTAPPICLSIPRNVMQNQYNFCSYLSQSHELWEQADLFVMRQGIFEGKTSQQWPSSESKFNFHIGSKLRTEN